MHLEWKIERSWGQRCRQDDVAGMALDRLEGKMHVSCPPPDRQTPAEDKERTSSRSSKVFRPVPGRCVLLRRGCKEDTVGVLELCDAVAALLKAKKYSSTGLTADQKAWVSLTS